MNREPPNKSLGFFDIYKEAYKITISWKKLFSQITLALILPLTILYLSDIHISDFIISKAYPNNVQAKWIVYGITSFVYLILILLLFFFSTSVIALCVSCFYTSKETTLKKVVCVFPKVWGRLLVMFLLLFLILGICAVAYLALIYWIAANFNGPEGEGRDKVLAFVICLSVPFFFGLVYITSVWNIAMVISVLEKSYGTKAMVKSMKLIKGKIWIIFAGITFTYSLLVVAGDILDLVGEVFVGIVCYLLATVLIHFSLVIQTVVHFVCKAYHNEDISNVAAHLDVAYVNLIVLATILPLTILYLSDIQISKFILGNTFQDNKKNKWIAFGITRFVYSILTLIFYLFSTSSVVYSVFCFYTSKDPNLKRVVGIFPKVWGRLLVTFLLLFFILAICTTVYLGLILLFVASFHGRKVLAFIICLTIPYFVVFSYMTAVWNIAMVISVLEKDYGRKALVKSMRLIKGKIWVSSFIFIAVEIIFMGMSIGFYSMVLGRKKMNLVAYFLNLYLVIQAVVYFVCKSYHNEDILNLAVHLEVSHDANFVRGNEE
ncbi:hypothetical protein MKW98_001623, partial [Papaver atlanticum]